MTQTELTQAAVKADAGTAADVASIAASKATAKAVGKTAANIAPSAGGWPVDDITGLARRLPEVDPANYFDGQAKESFQQSLIKWPVLARLMNLLPADEASVPVERNPAQKQEVE
ncbi:MULTISPECIES: hypothetical protein [unclassified Paraburkholderia]|jgi:hypothetical protein|uniref:hypothetical protein n=1 Tax=unclassified Paraburkholderia TaxID=2615204 RepID=UPI0038BA4DD3